MFDRTNQMFVCAISPSRPARASLAAAGLTALMAGATITNGLVLGVSPAVPVAFLLVSATIAWCRRASVVELVRR